MRKEIYGIDLGTTNSCIAEISSLDKLPIVVKNQEDLQTTPSVVFYDDYGTPIVGGEARRCMAQNPTRAVEAIKREMGNTIYQRKIGSEKITPVKISAMILKKIVDDANMNRTFQGLPEIKDVVITVPAYFGNSARELTKQAGEIAGLNVLALLNEPTAAALSYGLIDKSLEGKTFMVYDLGGGTFDVSIMRLKNGQFETLSTDGDLHLGGKDWDERLADYVLEKCGIKTDYQSIKGLGEGGALIMAVEACKKKLTLNDEAPVKFRYKGRMYINKIRRAEFEELTADLLQKTIDVMYHAMELSSDKKAVIKEIILVGGSSYMPMVKKRLGKEFPHIFLRLDRMEPDLAVAKGAAIHAYNLANVAQPAKVTIVKDLGSRSYGIEVYDPISKEDRISNLIRRSDPMIFSGVSFFKTYENGATSVWICICESISNNRDIPLEQGTRIFDKSISWGYPVPKNTKIIAEVKRGADGIVHIVVTCQNKSVSFDIEPEQMLSKHHFDKMKKEMSNMQF